MPNDLPAPDLSIPEVIDNDGKPDLLHAYERVWLDINKIVEFEVFGHRLEFKAYDITVADIAKPGGPVIATICYRYDGSFFTKPEEDRTKADVMLHGFINWDGCSNWRFDAAEDIAAHFCDRKGIEDFCAVLLRIHGHAKAIPMWEGD